MLSLYIAWERSCDVCFIAALYRLLLKTDAAKRFQTLFLGYKVRIQVWWKLSHVFPVNTFAAHPLPSSDPPAHWIPSKAQDSSATTNCCEQEPEKRHHHHHHHHHHHGNNQGWTSDGNHCHKYIMKASTWGCIVRPNFSKWSLELPTLILGYLIRYMVATHLATAIPSDCKRFFAHLHFQSLICDQHACLGPIPQQICCACLVRSLVPGVSQNWSLPRIKWIYIILSQYMNSHPADVQQKHGKTAPFTQSRESRQ